VKRALSLRGERYLQLNNANGGILDERILTRIIRKKKRTRIPHQRKKRSSIIGEEVGKFHKEKV